MLREMVPPQKLTRRQGQWEQQPMATEFLLLVRTPPLRHWRPTLAPVARGPSGGSHLRPDPKSRAGANVVAQARNVPSHPKHAAGRGAYRKEKHA
jgi:hypothetical protein